MPQALPIIAIAATAAATGYQINRANKARRDANQQRSEEQRRQDAQQNAETARVKKEEDEGNIRKQRLDARKRQRRVASAGQGRQDTILTGPLGGEGGQAGGGGKTLLGG